MYLVDHRLLIDTTTGLHKKALNIAFANLDISKEDIQSVVLTHEHFDHIGGIGFFPEANIIAHEKAAQVIETGNDELSYAHYFNGHVAPRKVQVKLKDKDTIRIGDLKLEIIHTPGHTEGSICIYEPMNKILFSGDTVFKESTGRTDLISGSEKELEASLEKLEKFDINIILPGHQGIVETEGNKHIKNILVNLRLL